MTPAANATELVQDFVDQNNYTKLEVAWSLRPACTSQMIGFTRGSVSVGEWP